MDLAKAVWRKLSYSSANGGNCIEVAQLRGRAAVRDSKDPDGPALQFSDESWRAFIGAVKSERIA
jgi:hypothetical protein